MKKILISGYIGFDNFGDEGIFYALCKHLRGYQLSVLSNKKYENIKSYTRFDIFRAVFDCDVLISGGGSLLQNKTSNLSLFYYLAIIFLAKILNKKTIIFAQGIEPIRGKIPEILTKFALQICDFVSVRDKKSSSLLDSWNIKHYLLSDPIYSILPEVKKEKTGLVVQLRECAEGILEDLAQSIRDYYQGKITVLALQKGYDEGACLKFIQKLKQFGLSADYVYNRDINETIDILNSAKYVISTRLHGLLVSNALQARVFALSYDDKTDTALEELELEYIKIKEPEGLNNKLKSFFEAERKNKEYRRFSFDKIDEVLNER